MYAEGKEHQRADQQADTEMTGEKCQVSRYKMKNAGVRAEWKEYED